MANTYLRQAHDAYKTAAQKLVATLQNEEKSIQNIIPSALLDGVAADKYAASFVQDAKASPEYESSKTASAADVRRINRDLSVIEMPRIYRVAAFLTQLNDRTEGKTLELFYPGINL
ncbi:MAG: hypothetical protein WC910_07120 [Bacteroidales bacterium]